MRRYAIYIMVFIIILLTDALAATAAYGQEIKTHYVLLVYNDDEYLRQFDAQVSSRSLSCRINKRSALTAAEEAACKLDVIVDRVEAILDLFPRSLNFIVVLLPTSREVQQLYMSKYGGIADYVAFYSPRDNTVYVSANDVRVGVLAHELTHVIICHYFPQPPPAVIQEVVAQYVDSQIDD
jgi:hypothetical protein